MDGLVHERRNSSALAMELCLSCINPAQCLQPMTLPFSTNEVFWFKDILFQSQTDSVYRVCKYKVSGPTWTKKLFQICKKILQISPKYLNVDNLLQHLIYYTHSPMFYQEEALLTTNWLPALNQTKQYGDCHSLIVVHT